MSGVVALVYEVSHLVRFSMGLKSLLEEQRLHSLRVHRRNPFGDSLKIIRRLYSLQIRKNSIRRFSYATNKAIANPLKGFVRIHYFPEKFLQAVLLSFFL